MASNENFIKFRAAIEEMSQDEMFGTLKALVGTRSWVAIMKYQQARRSMAADSLCRWIQLKTHHKFLKHREYCLGFLT